VSNWCLKFYILKQIFIINYVLCHKKRSIQDAFNVYFMIHFIYKLLLILVNYVIILFQLDIFTIASCLINLCYVNYF